MSPQAGGALTAKTGLPLDLSLDFETARRAPPEDLRLPTGSFGVNNSAIQLGARPRRAFKVISKNLNEF